MIKQLGKTIFWAAALTSLLLLYVHEKVMLIEVSYRLDNLSENFNRKTEQYRQLKFDVEQLKAPRLLEEKMKSLELDLTLPKEFRVVPLRALTPASAPVQEVSIKPGAGFFQFLGHWVNVAQAKTEN